MGIPFPRIEVVVDYLIGLALPGAEHRLIDLGAESAEKRSEQTRLAYAEQAATRSSSQSIIKPR
jgi:hypothetical protein